jgi:hypothetical protein
VHTMATALFIVIAIWEWAHSTAAGSSAGRVFGSRCARPHDGQLLLPPSWHTAGGSRKVCTLARNPPQADERAAISRIPRVACCTRCAAYSTLVTLHVRRPTGSRAPAARAS